MPECAGMSLEPGTASRAVLVEQAKRSVGRAPCGADGEKLAVGIADGEDVACEAACLAVGAHDWDHSHRSSAHGIEWS